MCFARIFSGQPGVTPLSGGGRPENAGQSPTWAKSGRPKMGGIIQLARMRAGLAAQQSTGGPASITGTAGG